MQLAGFIVMTLGAGGIIFSTIMEIKFREPVYALLMKIMPLIFSIGTLIWSMGK